MRLVQVPKVNTDFRIMKTLEENVTDIVYKWQLVGPTIDNDLFLKVLLNPTKADNNRRTVKASFKGHLAIRKGCWLK